MSDCYLGIVDWNKDYKHVLQVNLSTQLNDILTHMNTHSIKANHIENIRIIKIENGKGEIQLDGYYSNFHFYNYIIFRNYNNINYYFAFIDSLSFSAPKTTHIHFTIDTWQMYSGTLVFKNSYVERMHVAKNEDTIGRWLAPEPFNFSHDYENVIDSVSNDFTPKFMVIAVSRPRSGQYDFEYGGQATGGDISNYTPYYGYKITNIDGLHHTLSWYEPRPDVDLNFIDHRQDIVGCVLIPAFVYNSLDNSVNADANAPNGQIPFPVAGTKNITVSSTISLNTNELACGYTPKNNKLFTSLCKKYILCNRNGLKIEMLPELFTSNEILINFNSRGFDTTTIKMVVGNYRFYSRNTFSLPYNATLPICYNQNDGVVKTLNTIKSVSNAVTNPTNIVGNIESIANSAFGSQGEEVGQSSGEYLPLTNYYFRPRLIDCSPLADQCREIDNYLSAYGYSIKEFILPSISNRSNWNYLQGDINFTVNALENDKQNLKNIFSNGVTVWHSPTNMMNYSATNN